ncbi:hypothetical protein YC2023_096339 [Brassica napus]
MASNPHRGGAGGSLYGGAAPYRSRDGLSTRTATGSEEIQLRIDPMHSDLDDEITGLHGQIAQEIGSEAKFQRDFLDELVSSVSATSDTDESTSRGEEQHKETELEHHTKWQQPHHARGSFRALLLLHSLHVVQDVQKMRDSRNILEICRNLF